MEPAGDQLPSGGGIVPAAVRGRRGLTSGCQRLPVLRGLLTALALCAAPSPASAQADTAVPPAGTRVRVHASEAGPRRSVGMVSGIVADTLFLERSGRITAAIPLEVIDRVDVSSGDRRLRGIVRGAGAGALAGALIFGVSQALRPSDCDYCPEGGAAIVFEGAVGAVILALPGAVIGGVVGADRWIPYPPRAVDRPRRGA